MPRREGLVCRLTGMCLKSGIFSSFTPIPQDRKKAACHGGVIRMGTTGRKRSRGTAQHPQRSIAPRIRIRDRVAGTIKTVFCSKQRVVVFERQKGRFFSEVDRLCRSKRPPFDIVEIDRQIRQKKAEFGRFLNPVPDYFPPPLLDSLTVDLVAHLYTIEKLSEGEERKIVVSTRLAEVYTACVCYWMSVGFSVAGNTIISSHPYFEQHVPPEICFGEMGFTCGHMSEFTRTLQRTSCVVQPDGSMWCRYGLKLTLSRNTIKLLDAALVIGQRRRMSASSP